MSHSPLDGHPAPLLKKRVQALFRHLPGAVGGGAEPIHQVRVAGRRLRITLPLIAAQPQGKRERRAARGLRRLVRSAGAARDADVLLALLDDELGPRREMPRPAQVLRRRFSQHRSRLHRQQAQNLLDLDLARLRRDLRKISARPGADIFTVLGRMETERTRRGAALLQTMESLGDRFDPAALHVLRKGLRRLRYAAEVGADISRPGDGSKEVPRILKQLQEQLGRIRDAQLLSEWFSLQAERGTRRHDEEGVEEARRLATHFLARSRHHHSQFLASQPQNALRRALALMSERSTAA